MVSHPDTMSKPLSLESRNAVALEFFRAIFGDADFRNGGKIAIIKNARFDRQNFCENIKSAARQASTCHSDGYFLVGLTASESRYSRGNADDVVALPCVFAEFDSDKIDIDEETLLARLDGLPQRPSILLHSGGGIHAYWLFDQHWHLTNADDRAAAKQTLRGWLKHLRETLGNSIDPVGDLARVLRFPGPINSKPERNGAVARLISVDESRRYSREVFTAYRGLGGDVAKASSEPVNTAEAYQEVNVDALIARLETCASEAGRLWRGETEETDQSKNDHEFVTALRGLTINDHNVLYTLAKLRRENTGCEKMKWDRSDYPARTIALGLKNYRPKAHEDFQAIMSTEQATRVNNRIKAARALTAQRWDDPELIIKSIDDELKYYRGDWYRYDWAGNEWAKLPLPDVNRIAMTACELAAREQNRIAELAAKNHDKPAKLVRATRSLRGDVMASLESRCLVDSSTLLPAWLDGVPPCDIRDVVPVKNGLLQLSTRTLHPASPNYFAAGTCGVNYDPDAECPTWLTFLDQVLGDKESIDTLAEFIGYSLTGDTSQQKMLWLIGQSRGGKGTIVEVIQELQGDNRISTPKAQHLYSTFGLSGAIDKYVACVQDVRIDPKKNTAEMVQTLLTWVGEDRISTEAKYKDIEHGKKARARLIITSNEALNIKEDSAALCNRLIVMKFPNTFKDKEDFALRGKLSAELPGILNWALDGLDRLQIVGRLIQPKAAEDLLEQIREATSETHGFFRDRCTTEPIHPDDDKSPRRAPGDPTPTIGVDALYIAYQEWCIDVGKTYHDKAQFGRSVASRYPHLTRRRPRTKEHGRVNYYDGIRLVSAYDD